MDDFAFLEIGSVVVDIVGAFVEGACDGTGWEPLQGRQAPSGKGNSAKLCARQAGTHLV